MGLSENRAPQIWIIDFIIIPSSILLVTWLSGPFSSQPRRPDTCQSPGRRSQLLASFHTSLYSYSRRMYCILAYKIYKISSVFLDKILQASTIYPYFGLFVCCMVLGGGFRRISQDPMAGSTTIFKTSESGETIPGNQQKFWGLVACSLSHAKRKVKIQTRTALKRGQCSEPSTRNKISEQFVKQEVNVLLSSFLDHSTSEAVFGFAISASMTAAGS